MKKYFVIILVVLMSLSIVCISNYAHASNPLITRVQGPVIGTTTSSSLSVTMTQTPQVGDVLIAVLGMEFTGSGTPVVFPQASETGVTWLSTAATSSSGSSSYNAVTILVGIVNSASASTTITMALSPFSGTVTTTKATVDVCEYSGLDSAYIQNNNLDQFTGNSGTSTQPDTGATGTTTYANELWIGGTLLTTYSQSSPTNGFTLLGGNLNNGISVAYLENIVSSTGQAEAGTTGAGKARWLAAIATFPAEPTVTLAPESAQPGDTVTISGSGFAVNSPMTATFGGAALTLSGVPTTDSSGDFTATFTVPTTATPNNYAVAASDNQATNAAQTLEVLQSTWQVTIASSDNSAGSVNPASGSYGANPTTITATANTGYQFVDWVTSGGVSMTSNSASTTTFTTSATGSIEAFFTSLSNPVEIASVQVPSTPTQTGFTLPLNVTLTNPDAASETVSIQVSTGTTTVFDGTATLNALQTQTVSCGFDANILPIGSYTFTVTVTTTSLPGSTPQSATAQSGVTYLGDLNGQGTVNFNDIVTFVGEYIAYNEHGTYYSNIDYDHNGVINFNDITLFVAYYEQFASTQ